MKKFLFSSLLLSSISFTQTITEKQQEASSKNSVLESEKELPNVNQELKRLRAALEECYTAVHDLHQVEAQEEEYQGLLRRVNEIKGEIVHIENHWRESVVAEAKREDDGYALWDQEETTLGQMVMEYGAMDYLYVVPPEMASMKLHMHSSIPIPRESWGEVLEIILAQNGIGVKKLNSYSKQLFVLKQDPSSIQAIASRPEHLHFTAPHARVFYVFSPPLEQMRSAFQFFERFSDAKQTFIYHIGNKIAIVSAKEEVEKMIALYKAVWEDPKGKVARVVPITKMAVKEMEKILQTFFGESIEKGRAPFGKVEHEGLSLMPLGQGSLILMGQQEVVDRAEKVIKDTEEQLQDPTEMTVFLYSCRHSNPDDLAKVLEKVYVSLLTAMPENGGKESVDYSFAQQGLSPRPPDGYASAPPLVVAPPPLKPGGIKAEVEIEKGSDHFISDPKTGTLLMVVRRDALGKIKELLRKLDVPKRMVQIEVLLFERRLNQQTGFGLNLLKIGRHNGVEYKSSLFPPSPDGNTRPGILEFFFHGGGSVPFDIAYSFLMTQEDLQLNAAPSVVTVNQTPATVSIVEERSIDNGASPVQASNNTLVYQSSFTRSQYGITIILTPTVHLPDDEANQEDRGFITLTTDITFDTVQPSGDNKPLVDRRHIENEVRVVDGQTVIIGGLRKKTLRDSQEKIPFLGDIPGLGKLFGSTKLFDDNTEMFFFITPKIVIDPKEDLDRIRREELKKRPGDIPEFLEKLSEALDQERHQWFQQSLKIFQ